jgi:hypothetical protein
MRGLGVVAVAIAVLGCGGAEAGAEPGMPERVLLTSTDVFHELLASEDPLSEHRPDPVVCNPLRGFYAEDGELEVATGHCNYLAVAFVALTDGTEGDRVTGSMRHFDLTSPLPAETHLQITWGEVSLIEAHISIPSPAAVRNFELTLPRDLGRDEPLRLHLHNHGQNTYQFASLWLERLEP